MPSYIRTRPEFAVNSYTAGSQAAPSVSTFADGGFVIAWATSDPTQDGDDNAIKAQLFDGQGRKVGAEFLVNSVADGGQFTPEVKTLANGGFVVSWITLGSDDYYSIKAQLFGRDGGAIGGEFQVNAMPRLSGVQTPNVAQLADGDFIISWDEGGSVKAQIFDSAGAPVGGILTLNTGHAHGFGDLTALANGGFVATWRTNGNSWDVRAQIFDASGGKVGGEFTVNTVVVGSQNAPSATALADGGFVITWSESYPEFQSGNTRIKAQVFTASGEKIGGELLVSTTTAYTMGGQVVTALPDGGFLIAWHTTVLVAGGGSDSEVRAQRFTADGQKVDGEFQINTLTTGSQWLAEMATLPDGRVVAAWMSGSGDIESNSIRAQILGTELADPLPNTRPIIISNGGGTSASLTHDEGLTAVTRVVASDDGEPNNLRYSITGGADAGLFTINALTGALAFIQPPDHEAPLDEGGDNFYNVMVSASDGELSGWQLIQISVLHVNQIAIVSDGGGDYALVSVDENQTAATTVSAVDTDGNPITYAITGGDDAAFFTIDPQTGELRFTVAPDYEWPANAYGDNVYLVYVTASDGTVSDTQGIAVEVLDVEDGAGGDVVITSDGGGDEAALTVAENGNAVTVVAASGAGPVTYEIVGGADAWQFTIDPYSGALEFIYPPDYESASDADFDNVYEVTVSAGNGLSYDEQYLFVTVENVDEAPEIFSYGGADNVALTIAENGWQVADVSGWDPDGFYVEATFSIVGGADAALFTVNPLNGVLTFVDGQRPDFEAPADADGDNVYDVTVALTSGALSDTQAFAVTIASQNEGIFITSNGGGTSAAIALDEGQSHVTTVVAYDPDGTIPVYSIVGGPDAACFAIDPETGVLTFVEAPDYEAPADQAGDNFYTVEVAASDGEYTTWQSVQILVGNVDEDVTIRSHGGADHVALSVAENGVAVTQVAAIDGDGAAVTYALSGGADAALFTIDAETGALSFIEAADYEAPADAGGDNVYDVVVSATGGNSTDTQAFAVTVSGVNEAVVISSNGGGSSAALAVNENGSAVTVVAAADPDGGAVTYAIAGGADAARFAIDAETGALAFVAPPNFEAPADAGANNVYNVIVSASDGSSTDTQALAVTVGNVNEPVAITSNGGGASAVATIAENGSAVTTVTAADPDSGTVSYAIAGGADAARFTINAATGALAFVAAPNFEAPGDAGANNVYNVIVSASDGGFTDTQAIAVTVGNVNEPVAISSNGGGGSAAVAVAENGGAVTVVAAADPDGGAVTYAIAGGADAARFTIDAATGALAFVAAPNFEAPADAGGDNIYNVIVSASDGTFADTQALAVSVTNVLEGNTIVGTSSGNTIGGTKTVPGQPYATNLEDTIYGLGGADTLLGAGGDDIIDGGAGNDAIVGGAGADELTGGTGADRFILYATGESPVGAADLIRDFSRSQGDRISLIDIDAKSNVGGNQAFAFIGTAAFSGVAGQLRFEQSGGNTFVSGDVNGDRVADFQIELQGLVALTSADFIL